MIRSTLCVIALSTTFSTIAPSQLLLPVIASATFLQTSGDPGALDAFSVPLWAFGVTPGTWIGIRSVGTWDDGLAGDTLTAMIGVFSSSDTLLASNVQHRVQNAIPGGTSAALGLTTAIGNLPMEIGEDFWIARDGFAPEVLVQVPANATDLFIGVPDAYYGDNSDPNSDFAVLLWVAPPPVYPGTGEDLEIWIDVNATPQSSLPEVHVAPAGSTLNLEVHDLLGTQAGNPFVLVMDAKPTGTPFVGLFPGTSFGASSVVLLGPVALPPSGFGLSAQVPPGLNGVSVLVQAGTLTPTARNGSYVTSHAHEVQLH